MKTHLVCLAFAFSAGALFAGPSAPTDPSEQRKARELVLQLGSPRYRDREKAATELVKMGRAAKPALLDGKANTDPEVRSRCEQLLPQALSLDLMFRVDRFLKDADGKLDHDLPLWKAYREKVGTDATARETFAEMLKADGALLESVEEEPARLTERVQQRTQEMYQRMFGNGFRGGYRSISIDVNELSCLLFVMAQSAYKPAQPDWMFSQVFSQPNFTTLIKDEKKGAAHRKVFFHYLDVRMDENMLHQCAWIFSNNRMKEGADVIAKALRSGKDFQVYTKATALCCIGTLGGKEHLKAIEPYLKDDTMVQQAFIAGGAQRGAIKVRDVALAMTIHLSGKNPKDYGFPMWQVHPNNLIQYHQLGFASDDDRSAAFKKWDEESRKAAKKE